MHFGHLVTKTTSYATCPGRENVKTNVKKARVKVASPQKGLKRRRGLAEVWLLDTNNLWSGAFSVRRKVVHWCFQSLLFMTKIYVLFGEWWAHVFVCQCGYSWDQGFLYRRTLLTSEDTHQQKSLSEVAGPGDTWELLRGWIDKRRLWWHSVPTLFLKCPIIKKQDLPRNQHLLHVKYVLNLSLTNLHSASRFDSCQKINKSAPKTQKKVKSTKL